MSKIVAVVICSILALPASAAATGETRLLLKTASQRSGLPVRAIVRTETLSGRRYDALLARAVERSYPRSLRRLDLRMYALLGMVSSGAQVPARVTDPRAWYDPALRKLLLRRTPRAGRAIVINELTRALVDQNFDLRHLAGLRVRDRDRALAATAIVDGTAALASRLRPRAPRGTPLERFLELQWSAALGPGRALAEELRYLGGNRALRSALREYPQTTEQLLHIDKFLERERALPVRFPSRIGSATLAASETFGELDVRNLLQAFRVADASAGAAGWGGGRIGLYESGTGSAVAALVIRWDTPEDAAEWHEAFSRYVATAFPGTLQHDCPPLDHCWSGSHELAAGALAETSVFASGPGSAAIAAALLIQP